MSTILFYDTETTGLPLFKEPSENPYQPHIVQLAAILVDDVSRKTISSINVIVKPDGWDIPNEVSAIHGITTEYAQEFGVNEGIALDMFLELWNKRTRIAHNESFDARIIRIAIMRHINQELADIWKDGKSECTQILSTPILNLPPTQKMLAAGFKKAKSANLQEAYKHFKGVCFENSHSAMADVKACAEVYFAIKDSIK